MEDFKFIWMMEYGHRMWGRCIGKLLIMNYEFFYSKSKRTLFDIFRSRLLHPSCSYVGQGLFHTSLEKTSGLWWSPLSLSRSNGLVYGKIWPRSQKFRRTKRRSKSVTIPIGISSQSCNGLVLIYVVEQP